MVRIALLAGAVLALFSGAGFSALAQGNTETAGDLPRSEASTVSNVKLPETDNPHLKRAQEKAMEIAKVFTEQEINDLAQLRDAFGIVRSVSVVRRDVGNAVRMCGKDNPDLKDSMAERFATWDKTVGDALSPQEKKLKETVNGSRFSKPADVQAFLDLLDKAAEYAETRFEKQVVTTPEACNSLLKSMDRSERIIAEHLSALKFPGDVKKADEAVKPASAEEKKDSANP